jgi:hypothetical protein
MCYHITSTSITPVMEDASVIVYPNPASNMVSIQNDDATQTIDQVFLIEMATGKVVLSKTFRLPTHRKYDLNINEISAGSYLLRIQTTNGNMIKHLQIIK